MPTTVAMTRRLNGSRNTVFTSRDEYCVDVSWTTRSEMENATPANEMVAPATVPRRARALSTVEGRPRNSTCEESSRRSSATVANPAAIAANTAVVGNKKRLVRPRSNQLFSRSFIGGYSQSEPGRPRECRWRGRCRARP